MNKFFTKLMTLIVLILFAFSLESNSEELNYAEYVPNNAGIDFWLALPPPYLVNAPGDFFKIYITSAVKTKVTLEISGTGVFQQKETLPNDVIVFDLSFSQAQPFNYACCNEETPPAQVYEGRGIHVYSDAPIVVYAVVRIRYTSDGYLAIPTSAMGTEYIAAPYTSRPFKGVNSFPNFVTLVAAYDKTKITMKLGGTEGTSVRTVEDGEIFPGEETTFILKKKGDLIVVPTIATKQNQTIAGSYFSGTKPFGLVSGHFCADIPTDIRACDYNVEMDIPMHTWGKHYFVPKVQNRDHSGLLRIFAKEDGTNVYKDGKNFAYIPKGKGGVLNEGWIENRTWPRMDNNDAPRIALYSADKPISITYFNPSAQDDAGNSNSDPFAMAITPVEQFQTELTFSTPAAKGGDNQLNGYKENYLMMVYETSDPTGAPPEDLEWGVVGKDETVWKKVSTVFSGKADKYQTLDGAGGSDDIDWETPLDDKIYGHLNIQLPGQGVFSVRSVDRLHNFAVYAYGYDTWDSYGYPTSTALIDISVEDQVAPNITKASNCSNTEWNGTASEGPANLENRSGFYSISLDYKSSENFSLIPVNTIQPPSDASQVLPWKLKVENPLLPGYAVLVFLDRAGNFTLDTTEYFPLDISVFEKNTGYDENWDFVEDWGLRKAGQENAESNTFIIENLSENNSFNISDISLSKKDEGFTITKINGIDYANFSSTFNLLPQTSLEIEVEFWTDKWGDFLDIITVYDCDSNKYAEIELTAKVGNAVMSVNDLTFDSYDIDLKDIENNETVFKNFAVENIICESDSLTYESILPLVLTGFSSTLGEEFDLSKIESTFEQGGGKIEIAPGGVQIFSLGFKASELKSYSGKISFEYEDGTKICSNESNVSVQTISTSIQDWPSDWTLSPNPASSELRLNNLENGKYELFVYNTASILVMKNAVTLTSGELSMDVSALSSAVYFLELKKDEFSYRTKFVKN